MAWLCPPLHLGPTVSQEPRFLRTNCGLPVFPQRGCTFCYRLWYVQFCLRRIAPSIFQAQHNQLRWLRVPDPTKHHTILPWRPLSLCPWDTMTERVLRQKGILATGGPKNATKSQHSTDLTGDFLGKGGHKRLSLSRAWKRKGARHGSAGFIKGMEHVPKENTNRPLAVSDDRAADAESLKVRWERWEMRGPLLLKCGRFSNS